MRGRRCLRVGEYRIVCEVLERKVVVLAVPVAHRHDLRDSSTFASE